MIRLAFLLVTLLGGLIAFGAFYLVRGDGSAPAPTETVQPEAVQPETPPAPVVVEEAPDPLYFLQGIDLSSGVITLVLNPELTGDGAQVVVDQTALVASQDVVFVNETTANGGMVAMTASNTPPQSAFALIYRDDALISALTCTTAPCGEYAAQDIDLTPLIAAAQPLVAIEDSFDHHDDYLATIDAIAYDPNYMLLDGRPDGVFPSPKQTPQMQLALPTLVFPADTSLDPNVTSALARSIVEPLLPEGATISDVVFTPADYGIAVDGDRGTPVLAGGAPIAFPAVKFMGATVHINGIATLDDSALASLSDQALQRTNYQDAFETFVRDRLQSDCVDCFSIKMNGDFYDDATVIQSTPENYRLDYYDLREAP